LDDDALCGIAVDGEESDDEDDDEIVAKEPFTDDDINEVTEQLKRHATFLQTDCSGAFDKAAVALMDAASSILRTNRNLKQVPYHAFCAAKKNLGVRGNQS
jgi:hypothetical protein